MGNSKGRQEQEVGGRGAKVKRCPQLACCLKCQARCDSSGRQRKGMCLLKSWPRLTPEVHPACAPHLPTLSFPAPALRSHCCAYTFFTPCRTPCLHRVYDALPPESRTAYVQLMVPEPRFNAGNGAQQAATLPSTLSTLSSLRTPLLASSSQLQQQRWKEEEEEAAMALLGKGGPSCALFLAATGDQGYARRMKLGLPLLKQVWLVGKCGCVGNGAGGSRCHGMSGYSVSHLY